MTSQAKRQATINKLADAISEFFTLDSKIRQHPQLQARAVRDLGIKYGIGPKTMHTALLMLAQEFGDQNV